MTRAVKRWVGAGAAALLIVIVGFALWSRVVLHQWPWQSLPDSVHVCGHDFNRLGGDGPHSAGPYTRAELPDGSARVNSWWTLKGDFEVWASGHCGTDLGTEVFVRAPSGFFYGYVAPSN